jgi:hypothetical protein
MEAIFGPISARFGPFSAPGRVLHVQMKRFSISRPETGAAWSWSGDGAAAGWEMAPQAIEKKDSAPANGRVPAPRLLA